MVLKLFLLLTTPPKWCSCIWKKPIDCTPPIGAWERKRKVLAAEEGTSSCTSYMFKLPSQDCIYSLDWNWGMWASLYIKQWSQESQTGHFENGWGQWETRKDQGKNDSLSPYLQNGVITVFQCLQLWLLNVLISGLIGWPTHSQWQFPPSYYSYEHFFLVTFFCCFPQE